MKLIENGKKKLQNVLNKSKPKSTHTKQIAMLDSEESSAALPKKRSKKEVSSHLWNPKKASLESSSVPSVEQSDAGELGRPVKRKQPTDTLNPRLKFRDYARQSFRDRGIVIDQGIADETRRTIKTVRNTTEMSIMKLSDDSLPVAEPLQAGGVILRDNRPDTFTKPSRGMFDTSSSNEDNDIIE